MQNPIKNIGADLVQISRIEKLYLKYEDTFAKKILSKLELEKFNSLHKNSKVHYLAKRFAAKEALVKAFGTGFRNGIWFTDFSILNNELGAPVVELHNKALDFAKKNNINNILISLSDEKMYALAFVVLV